MAISKISISALALAVAIAFSPLPELQAAPFTGTGSQPTTDNLLQSAKAKKKAKKKGSKKAGKRKRGKWGECQLRHIQVPQGRQVPGRTRQEVGSEKRQPPARKGPGAVEQATTLGGLAAATL